MAIHNVGMWWHLKKLRREAKWAEKGEGVCFLKASDDGCFWSKFLISLILYVDVSVVLCKRK
jgi:hypothetical protein